VVAIYVLLLQHDYNVVQTDIGSEYRLLSLKFVQIRRKPAVYLQLTRNSLVPTDQTLASYGAQEAVESCHVRDKRQA